MSDRTFRFWLIVFVFYVGVAYAKMSEHNVNIILRSVVTVVLLMCAHGALDMRNNRRGR
jgi:heme O synthase-like polyprenyltransferase